MAAKKPIISTPIKDVVRDYKDCVSIVDNSADFVIAVNEIYDQENEAKEKRENDFNEILEKTSWIKQLNQCAKLFTKTLNQNENKIRYCNYWRWNFWSGFSRTVMPIQEKKYW